MLHDSASGVLSWGSEDTLAARQLTGGGDTFSVRLLAMCVLCLSTHGILWVFATEQY